MTRMELKRQQALDFLKNHKLMSVASFGDFPWIASVYYTFDNDLNVYFLSSPTTLHCKQIEINNKVAISIADSDQDIGALKRGLQISGIAERISDTKKVIHALKIWKQSLGVKDPELTYENMIKQVINGRMYKIIPKRIKLFDQKLFPVEDGEEPVLNL